MRNLLNTYQTERINDNQYIIIERNGSEFITFLYNKFDQHEGRSYFANCKDLNECYAHVAKIKEVIQ